MAPIKPLGVALVTGAAQGIGKAIAMRLASDGFKVALNDVPSKREQFAAVAREIDEKYGLGTFVAPADVSQEMEVKEMVESSSKALGGLDVMVANAGIVGVFKPIMEMSLDEWDEVQRVNLRGAFLCYKYGAKEIVATGRPGGRIIGASSAWGRQGTSSSAALELGEHGITVNAYAPGIIRTAASEPVIASGVLKKLFPGFPPFGKIGEPEDIASIVSYLASKESHYITGFPSTLEHISISNCYR
ncbi:putative short chain oxidoreductase [Gymnopus androsaceus JB14]|uniref:Short chain oxidoreductase n=1 Tax=Gymnopus androsaceus JB14 TaxID=1447944 RepID=A0A6A4HTG2_9AGAR|nr:putative short chain oxidoreductase [Gymnopus androsaceus JB14]